MHKSKFLIFILFSLTASLLSGQEICDDGIDNDGDSLIDLNDDDCICESTVPSGLIPNPSFEERSCCPDNKEQLYCADSWQQASNATTDYVNTCGGFLGHNGINNSDAPQPFPDGEGAIGFRDGQSNASANYKEYTGSGLLENMVVGTSYRFDFFVGFPDRPQHPSVEIAVYGTTNRNAIPFGGGIGAFGCPTNDPNFDLIGSQTVTGSFEWVNVFFEFIPQKPYAAIVLGPGCAPSPTYLQSPYFFLDRLALAEKSEFNVPFSEVTGSICTNDLVLTAPGDFAFQWYLDGVALTGEEGKTLKLDVDSDKGNYSVRMSSADGCFLSVSYDLEILHLKTETSTGICEGEILEFGQQNLTAAGEYTEVFAVGTECDSTVVLTLEIYLPTEAGLEEELCPGDSLIIGSSIYTEEGAYVSVIPNANGCDSTIYLEVVVVDDIEELLVEDTLYVDLGEKVDLVPISVSPDAERFEWISSGEVISDQMEIIGLSPLENQNYTLNAYTKNDCLTQREVTIIVDDEVKTFIPNVFSAHSAAPNDRFIVRTNSSVSEIKEIRIYDRWGSIVHFYSGPMSSYNGWDGRAKNKEVEQGVYTYLVEFGILDGRTLFESGTITLIR